MFLSSYFHLAQTYEFNVLHFIKEQWNKTVSYHMTRYSRRQYPQNTFKKAHPISQVRCTMHRNAQMARKGQNAPPFKFKRSTHPCFSVIINILNGHGYLSRKHKDIANCWTINQRSPFSHSIPISAIVVGLTFAIIRGFFASFILARLTYCVQRLVTPVPSVRWIVPWQYQLL